MAILGRNSFIIAAATLFIFFMIDPVLLYQQQQQPYFAYAEQRSCIDYNRTENTITIKCDTSSFRDVVDTINDDQAVLSNLGDGQYLLNANLRVDDGATFSMSQGEDGINWLKIAGANGIIVDGRIEIDGVKITSWDTLNNSPVFQTTDGLTPRAYINLRGSESDNDGGGFVRNSEIAYLGYQDFGKRGFDLFGGDGHTHNFEISDSKFHDMWFAFYSRGAYGITIDGNEYYNNIKYALDPHSGTHDVTITNNWLHDNPIGVICSDQCYNILIEGNRVEDNTHAGIFFSRGMHDSIARNNYIHNTSTGIIVSESFNNQIYSNTIEGATRAGIGLFNPPLTDDGVTQNNHVYNNTISDSAHDIIETRSYGNILEDNKFYDTESGDD
ncbi:MAG: right-handed parallel beta-helix repeat-containing protein [Thermoproteota archaeon]|nr:right-handed parallel beta-helix repeat-containing protein [Thermoproteota archaeon]